jgi:hypothetical protein
LHQSLFAVFVVVLFALATPAAALDSKGIYQLNQDRVVQVRVLNRETGKK